jgi:tRNA(Leu) C34 or U34 (ribose-2'-O)-methylase TrmL
MEGCSAAFNATNCIRTCLFFAAAPPTFLNATGLGDIHKLERQHRGDADTEHDSDAASVARFAPEMADPSLPTVVLENFVDRAQSIETFEFPQECNIVAGHENDGVSSTRVAAADHVVFVPQYGTISSLNVVTSMGIALFHHRLHSARRERLRIRRTQPPSDPTPKLIRRSVRDVDAVVAPQLEAYTAQFKQALPVNDNGTRADLRPIHPLYYHLSHDDIMQRHSERVQGILSSVAQSDTPGGEGVLRLSVLYENDVDMRNLGGLIRNANSFLTDVYYTGRRKINRQGTVGSNHYTNITHLGDAAEGPGAVAEALGKQQLELWCVDNEHRHLLRASGGGPVVGVHAATDTDEVLASLPVVALDADDEVVAAALLARRRSGVATRGIMLLIPQEGIAPCAALLRLCTRRVVLSSAAATVSPDDDTVAHRGIASQISAGIVLQRLFSLTLRL